jgi:hypothetical protein
MRFDRLIGTSSVITALCLTGGFAQADTVSVGVDPSLPWVGFVNVFELPTDPGQDRGAYATGIFLGAGIEFVPATFAGSTLVLGASTLGGLPSGDPFWWQPDGSGGYVANKVLESNVYLDEGFTGIDLSGVTLTFSGTTLTQDLPAGYAAYAWIRDFDPGYGALRSSSTVQLVGGQAFTVELPTSIDGVVQYGFAVVGPNADAGSLLPGQTVTIATAVPEPGAWALMLAGGLALAGLARRSRTL